MLGPFVDDTDGKTTEEALTLSQADLHLSKNGAASAQKNDATSATHRYGGNYMVDLDATDTNTLGHLRVMCKESGALPVIADFMVVPANVYNSLVSGSDNLEVDTTLIDGSDATDQVDTAVRQATTLTQPVGGKMYAITEDNTSSSIKGSSFIGVVNQGDYLDLAALRSEHELNASGTGGPSVENDVSIVYGTDVGEDGQATSIHIVGRLNSSDDNCVVYAYDFDASGFELLGDIAGTDEAENSSYIFPLLAKHTGDGSDAGKVYIRLFCNNQTSPSLHIDRLLVQAVNDLSSADTASAVWDETLSGHTTAGTAGKAVTDIEADTNELQSDDVPGLIAALNDVSEAQVNAQVDTAISDAALATAASLATVDANVDAVLVDTGTTLPAQISGLNDLSAADVNAEVDTALADYDAPTKAELDAGLAALNDPTAAAIADAVMDESLSGHTTAGTLGKAVADIEADTNELQSDDVPGLIAALNDLSTAEVNAEVDTAITDAALATAANLATVDAIVDAILVDTGTTIPALIAALNDVTAAEVADAVLDEATAGHTTPGTVGALLIDVLADTNELQADDVPALIAALNDLSFADIMRTQVTEAYPTAGQTATLEGFINFMIQFFTEFALVNTTYTVKELDKTTTAAVLETDDANDPTSMTRTS